MCLQQRVNYCPNLLADGLVAGSAWSLSRFCSTARLPPATWLVASLPAAPARRPCLDRRQVVPAPFRGSGPGVGQIDIPGTNMYVLLGFYRSANTAAGYPPVCRRDGRHHPISAWSRRRPKCAGAGSWWAATMETKSGSSTPRHPSVQRWAPDRCQADVPGPAQSPRDTQTASSQTCLPSVES
jgi:hypothetical protein